MTARTCNNPDCTQTQPLPLTDKFWYRNYAYQAKKHISYIQPCKVCVIARDRKRRQAKPKKETKPRYEPSPKEIKAMRKIIDKEKMRKMLDK